MVRCILICNGVKAAYNEVVEDKRSSRYSKMPLLFLNICFLAYNRNSKVLDISLHTTPLHTTYISSKILFSSLPRYKLMIILNE